MPKVVLTTENGDIATIGMDEEHVRETERWLTNDIKVLMRGESDVINCGGEEFRFYPLWDSEIQDKRRRMAKKGYTKRLQVLLRMG